MTAAKVKERPVVFSGPMVRAIIEGRKTQTRRVVKFGNVFIDGHRGMRRLWDGFDWSGASVDPGPSPAGNAGPYLKVPFPEEESRHRVYPLWSVGERLWVREKHARHRNARLTRPHYYADGPRPTISERHDAGLLRDYSPIHMPRWASRLTLEITGVRVERVQYITRDDVIAEGVTHRGEEPIAAVASGWHEPYAALFDAINGAGSWDANPWVWVIEFRRVEEANDARRG